MTTTNTPQRARVLVAEQDDTSRLFLADNLSADQFHVSTAGDQHAALELLRITAVEVLVVDVNGDTLALLDVVRDGESLFGPVPVDVPVIALTAIADELHRIRLLDRGADDVLVKPYSYPELRSRIKAVLRRSGPRQPPRRLCVGPVRIDLRQRSVSVDDRLIELSRAEYALLTKLASEPARVFTRGELAQHLWGCSTRRGRALDSHACRLRAKLGAQQPMIINVWGVGYRLIDGAPQ